MKKSWDFLHLREKASDKILSYLVLSVKLVGYDQWVFQYLNTCNKKSHNLKRNYLTLAVSQRDCGNICDELNKTGR